MNEHKPLQMNFKKKQRKAVLKLVALLLVVVTLLLSSAWAWFRGEDDQHATAHGIQITLGSPNSLLISVSAPDQVVDEENIEWKNSIDIISDTDLLDNLDMIPVTGLGYALSNGENYLYVPGLKYDANGEVSVNRDVDWSEARENVDYISLKVSFKTAFPADIYIGKGTTVTTWSQDNGFDLVGDNIGNVSKYGDFSRDAIVGALRMSVSYPETESKFLWVPRPDVYLSKDVASDEYILTASDQVLADCWNGSHTYYDLTKYAASTKGCAMSSGAFTATENSAVGANELTKIGSTEDGVTCTVFLKIWIDGCDSEAVQALSRGKFRLNLNFVAVETTG